MVIASGEMAFHGWGNGEPWVKVGNRVTFLKHGGVLKKINDEDYRIINDEDLLTVFTEEEVEIQEEN
jgi:co-chaperonin GroES (HSP10)